MLCLRVSFLKGLLNMYWAELNMLYRVILSPFSFLTCIQKDTLSVFTFAGIKCYLKPLSQLSNTGKKMNLRDKYLWGFWERREKKDLVVLEAWSLALHIFPVTLISVYQESSVGYFFLENSKYLIILRNSYNIC